ncbi:MAG: hypothetical protein E7116_01520 [Bacteroidales bacterium]|nr:hypothetical protein [Bacteroidales bacterium]
MRKLILTMAIACAALVSSSGVNYPDIKYGPWIQNLTETGFTVMWKSSQKNFAFVEVAPDDGTPFEISTRKRFYNVLDGRRLAGTFHSITVTGLEPGTAYRYKIYAKVVENDDSAYGTDYGPERKVSAKQEAVIRTLDRNAEKCSFFMMSDIHGKDEKYKALVTGVDKSKFDFLLMNGDMISYINDADTMLRHVFHVVPELTSAIPTIYTRGNHETRGRDAHYFAQFCPTPSGRPYFMFRQGPVAFLILDGGEDKPDSAPEYSGTVEFDVFRQAELEWLKEVIKDSLFVDAPIKVAVMHIPALLFPDSWYAQVWLNKNFVPVLNDAGVDVMLSGHHHQHLNVKAGDCGNEFPIIANDDTDRLEFEADDKGWHIRTFDMDGKLTHSYDVLK